MFSPTPDEAQALGRVLRAMREGVGLSIREEARRVELTHSTLSRFERGERIISAETLARVARVIADEIAATRNAA